MRKWMILIGILLLVIPTFSCAQGRVGGSMYWGRKDKEKEEEKESKIAGMMCPMMGGMHGGMTHEMMHMYLTGYPIRHILHHASDLELTDEQKKELKGLEEKYLYPLVRKEADLRITQMRLIDLFMDPTFDPAKAKTEAKVLTDTILEMTSLSVDALSAARKVLGPEKFKRAMEMMPMTMRGGMTGVEEKTKKEEKSEEHEEHH